MTEQDYLLALKLQQELDNDKGSPSQEPRRLVPRVGPSSLVSPEWELIDPNPDVHSLFQVFNNKFFWGQLGAVEVKWSPRMYSSAGICTYRGRGGCTVSLSLPLLKLRPRKDLVETLLHEMIHAYLFVTHNNKDRDGHGPEFHKHMDRINLSAGTRISVYHNFIDEVKVYQTHWWKCDGPCQFRPPYFGLVKKPMNRAPGRHDTWYARHKASCGGNFIKIKEPENYRAKKKPCQNKGIKDISNYFKNVKNNGQVDPNKESVEKSLNTLQHPSGQRNSPFAINVIPRTNIHGFSNGSRKPIGSGVEGQRLKSNRGGTVVLNPSKTVTSPSATKSPSQLNSPSSSSPTIFQPFSGKGYVLTPTNTSNSSRVFSTSTIDLTDDHNDSVSPIHSPTANATANCPVCERPYPAAVINDHIDGCLETSGLSAEDFDDDIEMPTVPPDANSLHSSTASSTGSARVPSKSTIDLNGIGNQDSPMYSSTTSDTANCPVCERLFPVAVMNDHIDNCLEISGLTADDFDENIELPPCEGACALPSTIKCPCCDQVIPRGSLGSHLQSCLI